MIPLTATTVFLAATWLLFGCITVVLWRRGTAAIARDDALRISMETMLMRARFRDVPRLSDAVLRQRRPAESDADASDGDDATDEELVIDVDPPPTAS